MKIVQINATNKIGSTGKIMNDLDKVICNSGYQGYKVCAYTNDYEESNLFCTNSGDYQIPLKKNIAISRITGLTGHRYKRSTKQIVQWIKSINPDIIHLHNIHGDWLELEVLFDYIKKANVPVVWTLHDCWAFTGRCSYFEMCGCEKWKTGCYKCTNKKVYPITYFFDFSKKLWKEKRELFSGLDCHIVVPSEWLGNYVKQSFLNCYPVTVIHNGIDTSVYEYTERRSKYLKDCKKKVVLGVASSWSKRKGFDDFIKLSEMLDSDKYQIVMVGLNDEQMSQIPKDIIGIKRTDSQRELVELYSSSDVFVNPTYQDNYPTTNLESVSCGTLAITYNTGGSPESIVSSQYVVKQGDVDELCRVIQSVCKNKPYTNEFLQNYGKDHFDKDTTFQQYITLYEEILRGSNR